MATTLTAVAIIILVAVFRSQAKFLLGLAIAAGLIYFCCSVIVPEIWNFIPGLSASSKLIIAAVVGSIIYLLKAVD